MTTDRGVADQPSGRGHGRRRVSAGTLGNSGSLSSTLTTPVVSQIVGASDHLYIMLPNLNYVPVPTANDVASIHSVTHCLAMPLSVTDTAVPKSSRRSQPANVLPLPSIIRITIRPDGRTTTLNLIYVESNKEQDTFIRKIYDDRMGRRLQQMLEDIRERGDHLTYWLCPKIKKALYVHWETDERSNRSSARSSKYTGSSATFMKTKARLSLDCDVILAETFKYTHTLKKNKGDLLIKFYTQRLEAATQQSLQSGEDASGIAISVVDLDAIWRENASALYKNCIYRLGSFFANSLCTSTLSPSSASATIRAVDLKEGIDLRLQVQKFTRSLHEQA
ncbi:hypothetical protein Ahy_A06g028575 [Arachis hypogaea]|uniref:Uncharacterized protein n=1 Tax=Arachis hypogaea TaxID=3818 RepID=A0A445CR95_ARAHY|nr:hypothetical protein Ahy_A06g028575 [Arachis hypogaea]